MTPPSGGRYKAEGTQDDNPPSQKGEAVLFCQLAATPTPLLPPPPHRGRGSLWSTYSHHLSEALQCRVLLSVKRTYKKRNCRSSPPPSLDVLLPTTRPPPPTRPLRPAGDPYKDTRRFTLICTKRVPIAPPGSTYNQQDKAHLTPSPSDYEQWMRTPVGWRGNTGRTGGHLQLDMDFLQCFGSSLAGSRPPPPSSSSKAPPPPHALHRSATYFCVYCVLGTSAV